MRFDVLQRIRIMNCSEADAVHDLRYKTNKGRRIICGNKENSEVDPLIR